MRAYEITLTYVDIIRYNSWLHFKEIYYVLCTCQYFARPGGGRRAYTGL